MSSNFKFFIIAILSSLVFANKAQGQLIFSESFTGVDGALSGNDDSGGVFWSTSCPDCIDGGDFFHLDGGKLKGQDTNGPAVWTTESIDISSCDFIEIQFDLSEEGDLEGCGTGCNSVDFVQFEYNIDGSGWTFPGDATFCSGACAGVMVIQSDDIPGGSRVYMTGCMEGGSSIQLRITIQTWAAAERWIVDNVQVSCAEGPEVDAGDDITICEGTEVILEAENPDGADINWDNDVIDGNPFTPGLGTIIYEVTATDGLCFSTDAVEIEVVPPAIVIIDPAGPYSESDPTQIMNASPLGGLWSSDCGACINAGTGVFDPSIAGPGVWEICYDAGVAPCDDHACIFVEVTEDCDFDVEINTSAPICFGDDNGSVTIEIAGTTGFVTYTISNEFGDIVNVDNENSASDLSSGWYYFLVEDEFPCMHIDSIYLADPSELELVLDVVNPACYADEFGSATVLDVLYFGGDFEDIYYTWTPNPSGIDGYGITNLDELPVGDYSVMVEDNNGCTSIEDFEILRPTALAIDGLVLTDINCDGGNDGSILVEVIGGTEPYTYSSDGLIFNPSNLIDELLAGSYLITVRDNNGCEVDTNVSLISLNPLPIVDFESNKTSGCLPLVVTFSNTGDGGISYVWNFGDDMSSYESTATTHTYFSPGFFDVSLILTDVNGCTNSIVYENLIHVLDIPVADFEFNPNPATILNSNVQFNNYSSNATSYLWQFDDLGTSELESPSFLFPEIVEQYEVLLIATNGLGCSDSLIKIVAVTEAFTVYIPNAFTPDGNHVNGEFKPYFNGIDIYDYQLTIYNRWGEVVFQSYNVDFGWNGFYGDIMAEEGVYVYHIITKENNSDKKLEYHGHVSLLR